MKLHRANWLECIGETLPRLASAAEVEAFEHTPYVERIAAQSTYEALQVAAAQDGDAPALICLKNADPDEPAQTVSYARLMERVTQAANLFGSLGVGPGDVVSVMLPLLPQAWYALLGAQAAGIANPVNPLLSARRLRRDPARRQHQGAGRPGAAAGHRHLGQGAARQGGLAGAHGGRRRARHGGGGRDRVRHRARMPSPASA